MGATKFKLLLVVPDHFVVQFLLSCVNVMSHLHAVANKASSKAMTGIHGAHASVMRQATPCNMEFQTYRLGIEML